MNGKNFTGLVQHLAIRAMIDGRGRDATGKEIAAAMTDATAIICDVVGLDHARAVQRMAETLARQDAIREKRAKS